jgi:hypothetical protein
MQGDEVLAPDFVERANRTCRSSRPFFDYVSGVLTTELAGKSVV